MSTKTKKNRSHPISHRAIALIASAVIASIVIAAPSPAIASGEALPKTLTLEQAVAVAFESNPSLTASRAQMAAAQARIDQSWSGFLPQLLVSMGYRRATMNSVAAPFIRAESLPEQFRAALQRIEPDTYNNFNASVALNHNIWDFGRTLGALRASKEFREGARADYAVTRDQVWLNVVQAFYVALAAREAVAVSEEVKRQMEQHVALAEAQVQAGIRQQIDVTRARSDLAQARMNLLRARNGELLARLGLATAMGRDEPPDFTVVRPPPSGDQLGNGGGNEAGGAPVGAIDPNDLEAAVREAIQRRPELHSLRAKARAQGELVGVAKAGRYPILGVNAAVSYQGYDITNLPYNFTVGASLSWNLLSFIPAQAAAREAAANAHGMEANLRALELAVRTEVQAAMLTWREARERLEPADALLTSARETLTLAEGRYQGGTGNIVEITDAQAVYVQARLAHIQAEFDVETARARLHRALGYGPGGKRE